MDDLHKRNYDAEDHIVPVAGLESFKILILTRLDNFRTLKFFRLESVGALNSNMFVCIIIFKKENK